MRRTCSLSLTLSQGRAVQGRCREERRPAAGMGRGRPGTAGAGILLTGSTGGSRGTDTCVQSSATECNYLNLLINSFDLGYFFALKIT